MAQGPRRAHQDPRARRRHQRPDLLGRAALPVRRRHLDDRLGRPDRPAPQPRQGSGLEEGLRTPAVDFDTFPLNDSSPPTGYPGAVACSTFTGMISSTDATLTAAAAYEPHVAEGINAYATNEFTCLSSQNPGHDVIIDKSALIHGVGLTAQQYATMQANGTSLIWSPRSNISLYGNTATVTEAARLGVSIALGTDWLPSGSMNMLRELRCADSLNTTYYGQLLQRSRSVDDGDRQRRRRRPRPTRRSARWPRGRSPTSRSSTRARTRITAPSSTRTRKTSRSSCVLARCSTAIRTSSATFRTRARATRSTSAAPATKAGLPLGRDRQDLARAEDGDRGAAPSTRRSSATARR